MSENFEGLDNLIERAKHRAFWRMVVIATLILLAVMSASYLQSLVYRSDSPVQGAQPVTPIRQVAVEGWMRAVGSYQELTLDTTTAQELTVPEGAHLVWLQAAGNTIRYRLDDTDPTTTVGFELYAGDYVLPPGLLYHMRFISESGTATLRAQPIGM